MVCRIVAGDTVKVLAGDYKGNVGVVTKVLIDRRNDKLSPIIKVVVSGVEKFVSNSRARRASGKKELERALHISNVALYDTDKSISSRFGVKYTESGKKVRYIKKTGMVLGDD